jgi:hypothetical protein
MRRLCEWITLAENRWPHIGRKLTNWNKMPTNEISSPQLCFSSECLGCQLARPCKTLGKTRELCSSPLWGPVPLAVSFLAS